MFPHRYNSGRDIDQSLKSNNWRGLDYAMSSDSRALLEQKCSRMILDCVDWRRVDESEDSGQAL